jgi:lipid-A-disaccharide synthase
MIESGKRIFVSAGEYSGSLYMACIVQSLKQRFPELQFEGIGGNELGDAGVNLLYNSDLWGSIGIVEALKRWRLIPINLKMQNHLAQSKPDLVILVDYPGFNMYLARKAKALNIPVIYLFPPCKFARSVDQIKEAASTITRVAAEFEATFENYRKAGASVEFVGHPVMDIMPKMSKDEAREKVGVSADEKMILLMPGSRNREIDLMVPVFEKTVKRLVETADIPLRFHLLAASNLMESHAYRKKLQAVVNRLSKEKINIHLFHEDRFAHMVAADFALVTSGTATLELAVNQVPMVICYKVSKVTELLARVFHSLPRYIGLPNLLADSMIVPEYIQNDASAENMAPVILETLGSETQLNSVRESLGMLKEKLRGPGAIERMHHLVCDVLALPVD